MKIEHTFIRLLGKFSPGLRALAVAVKVSSKTIDRECHTARIAVVHIGIQREPCRHRDPVLGIPGLHSICNHRTVEGEVEERFCALVVWDHRSRRDLPVGPVVIPSFEGEH